MPIDAAVQRETHCQSGAVLELHGDCRYNAGGERLNGEDFAPETARDMHTLLLVRIRDADDNLQNDDQ